MSTDNNNNKEEKKVENEEPEDLEVLKTRLDTSMGIARSLVESWLSNVENDSEEEKETDIKGRPPR